MAKKVPKLTIELIPKTCHFSNVRTTLKAKEWDVIRFLSYESAKNKCEICKNTGLTQGYRHKLECHEIWEYDDINHIQRLSGLISLCPLCHQVKHIGRANAMGRQKDVFQQLETINKWHHKQVVEHVADAFDEYKERSKYQWSLDLSLLTEPPYNLTINTDLKRKFGAKKRYKKRRRK